MKFLLEKTERIAALLGQYQPEVLQKEAHMPLIKIDRGHLHSAIKLLFENPETRLKYLNCISGTHLTETIVTEGAEPVIKSLGVEILYVISSEVDFSGIAIRVDLPEGSLEIDTIDDIYGSANWFEREIYDLLGVNFKNSIDLRRIMLPDDWEGHPLRKDYKENTSYNGIPTTRPDELAELRIES
jgi:NADH-quinone oxidoreductase subunit C